MKLLIMLDSAQVLKLTRPTKQTAELLEAERCLIIDTSKLEYFDPEIPEDIHDIESDVEYLGQDNDLDEDELFVGEDDLSEDADEDMDIETYEDDVNYN